MLDVRLKFPLSSCSLPTDAPQFSWLLNDRCVVTPLLLKERLQRPTCGSGEALRTRSFPTTGAQVTELNWSLDSPPPITSLCHHYYCHHCIHWRGRALKQEGQQENEVDCCQKEGYDSLCLYNKSLLHVRQAVLCVCSCYRRSVPVWERVVFD